MNRDVWERAGIIQDFPGLVKRRIVSHRAVEWGPKDLRLRV